MLCNTKCIVLQSKSSVTDMPTVINPVRPWMKKPVNKATNKATNKVEPQRETPAQKEARLAPGRFYRTKRWQHIREAQLQETPYCEECYKKQQRLVEATVVDHIKPIRQGGSQTDPENLASLCAPCHNRKRQTERYSMAEYRKRNQQ